MLGTITVTPEDIQNGQRNRHRHGPLSLAIGRAYRGKQVMVGRGFASIALGGESFLHNALPYEADKWNEDFHEGRPVSPFSFAMDDAEIRW